MSIYIRLNKELNPTTLVKQVAKEISRYRGGKLEDSFLCIEVKTPQHTVEGIVRKELDKIGAQNDRENKMPEQPQDDN
jgi:hypothetical protein